MRRWGLLVLGLGALAAVWGGPLPHWVGGSFSAHMAMHMGVVAVAAPLLALGLARGPADPVPFARAGFAPIPASFVELAVVWGWHAPGPHHFARHTVAGLLLEQGSFLVSGLWVWLSTFGAGAGRGGNRTGAGVLALLLTSMHMTLLGALLALPDRVLYPHAHAAGAGGLTPLQDQQLGGAIMLVGGGSVYLAGGLWLARGLLRRSAGAGLRP